MSNLPVWGPCIVAVLTEALKDLVKRKHGCCYFFNEMSIENLCVYQVSSLSQRVAELEGQLDRVHRDKSSLTNQLEDTLRKLTSQEQDNTKVQCVHSARRH